MELVLGVEGSSPQRPSPGPCLSAIQRHRLMSTHSSPFITYRALDNLPDWPSYPGFINFVAFLISLIFGSCIAGYVVVFRIRVYFSGLPAWASLIRILGCVFYSSQFPLRLLPADNDWSCITGCENMLIFNRIH